ncbi:MAG: type VI secretion system Vgr family protein [Pseudomonadota bacterium]
MAPLTAPLGTPWTQTDRLLRLTTPAGPDLLLAHSARINEVLAPITGHAGFRLEINAVSPDAHLDLDDFIGQPVRLDLLTQPSRTALRPFHGHVTGMDRLGSDGGFGRYRLIVEPWLAYLGMNRDSTLHQDQTVIEIVDEVLARWQGQGKLTPAWRWALADPAIYPKRSLTTQYQESDLAFLKRLLADEGLFYWFEHQSSDDPDDPGLGRHTMVIADHNGAFADDPDQPAWRYTQPGAPLPEDSLDRWRGQRQLGSTLSQAATWDYRAHTRDEQQAQSAIDNGPVPQLEDIDDPGQYAWPTREEGQRRLANQRQALDARHKHFQAGGTVRSAAPGRRFTLADHPEHDPDPKDQRHFLITAVSHVILNNLSLADFGSPSTHAAFALPPGTPHYRNQLTALRSFIPWRPLLADGQGRRRHPRPTVQGLHTALVVGNGPPTHTDRDLRIKVQFPWQRGSRAANRQPHPSGADNAPADDRLGVWLRLLAPQAGGNWGGHTPPRPGQEVLVTYLNGDIDRPLVMGALYNGQGQIDAQGNQLGAGEGGATPNAPAWYAGQEAAQAHHAALSGIRTRQLAESQAPQGSHNQLVFDDSPGQSRLELSSDQHDSRLHLGHLKEQQDNRRLADRGHGVELATQAAAALRAGSGLLLSADARPQAQGNHLDSREARDRHAVAHDLAASLAETAKSQNAGLPEDPDSLPILGSLAHTREVLEGTTALEEAPSDTNGSDSSPIKATQGGTGTVPAWSEPHLHYSAPAGLALVTPADAILASGQNLGGVAEQDIHLLAQANQALAVKDGLALFTVGQTPPGGKPNQETGIRLHAASGSVRVEAQSGQFSAAADQDVTLASTTASLTAQAATHLLATAQGAYLKIEGGNIELHAPGRVEFQASQKDWTGPASASYGELRLPDGEFELPKLDPALRSLQWQLHSGLDGELQADVPYQIVSDGVIVAEGLTDSSGQTQRHDEVDLYKPAEVWFGESSWTVQLEPDEDGPPAPLDEQIYDDEDDAAEA